MSANKISESVDKAMDKATPRNGGFNPGISIRNGPVTEDVEMTDANGVNGTTKRKQRPSASRPDYAESESSDNDDAPLVCLSRNVH